MLGPEPLDLLPVLALETLQDGHLPHLLSLHLVLVKASAATVVILFIVRVSVFVVKLALEGLYVWESGEQFLPLGFVLVTRDGATHGNKVFLELFLLLNPKVDNTLNSLSLFLENEHLGLALESTTRLCSKLVELVLVHLNTEHVELGLDTGLFLFIGELKVGLELLLLGEVGYNEGLGLVNNLNLAVAVLEYYI